MPPGSIPKSERLANSEIMPFFVTGVQQPNARSSGRIRGILNRMGAITPEMRASRSDEMKRVTSCGRNLAGRSALYRTAPLSVKPIPTDVPCGCMHQSEPLLSASRSMTRSSNQAVTPRSNQPAARR
eukprot:374457-Prymnesium_polylepis.2